MIMDEASGFNSLAYPEARGSSLITQATYTRVWNTRGHAMSYAKNRRHPLSSGADVALRNLLHQQINNPCFVLMRCVPCHLLHRDGNFY